VLAASKHAFPELCGAAKLLAISERTLRRKLRDRGVSYRHLRDEARCVTALAELPSSQRSLDEFAALLGFANITAFSRAFKRWTGDTPGNYRRKLGR
jgi:AraC-like DNA-binding protein